MTRKSEIEKTQVKQKWGFYLRQCRQASMLTQKQVTIELSKILQEDFSAQRYNNYETKNAQPSINVLRALTKILRVPADDLLNYNPSYSIDTYASSMRAKAGIKDTKDENTNLYHVVCKNGTEATLTYDQLISCTFIAKRKTDIKLKAKLERVFKYTLRMALWENIENKKLTNDENKHDVKMYDPFSVQSTEFCLRLATFRKLRNFSQTEFAKKLGLKSAQSYNRYEKQNAQPSTQLLTKMAETLQVSVNKLIDGYYPNIEVRALNFLNKIGYDFKYDNNLSCIILYNSHMNAEDAVDLALEEKEHLGISAKDLIYHLTTAMNTVKSNLESTLDEIFTMTFNDIFCQIIQTKPLPEKYQCERKDTELYLYQQDFLLEYEKNTEVLWTDLGDDMWAPSEPGYFVDGYLVKGL